MTFSHTSRFVLVGFLAAALVGCAGPNTGVVPIGSGVYMASKFGTMLTWSGGSVKADLYREAAEFCAKSGKQVAPLTSSATDSGMATYASAEIQFRCE